ncbi:DUF2637 domain-containing protein [Streptomyces sp. NPDC056500]|uniref:DUF2637 domain-containing protein n=1 Tax=Streptomyces sp. NPDC056500 TaxID=3345840 RepID=UPI0036AC4FB7
MRTIKVDAVLVQAVIAAALSFAHLHDLAAAAGQSGWKAWAYPISVDLLMVAAWRRLRSGATPVMAWSWFLIALFASLGANVATAGLLDLDSPPAWLRVLVAGWPALAFLGGSLLAHTPTAETPTEPTPTVASRVPVAEPAPDPIPKPDPAPALDPAPAPVAVPATPVVPTALVDHARKIAAEHQARTGDRMDADTLRTRLGVPPAMAHAIATQLT